MEQGVNGMSKFNFILVLAALLVAGCARSSTNTYTPPALEDDWSVNMTLSGGIAGLMRTIEVKADGRYTVADQRAGNTASGELTEDELARLEEMLSTLEFSTSKNPSACADCFVYDIEIISGGQKMIVNADDVTLGDSGVGPLAQFLRGIMDSALQ
jgi:hypothetical protein